jgi:hypothetical protein
MSHVTVIIVQLEIHRCQFPSLVKVWKIQQQGELSVLNDRQPVYRHTVWSCIHCSCSVPFPNNKPSVHLDPIPTPTPPLPPPHPYPRPFPHPLSPNPTNSHSQPTDNTLRFPLNPCLLSHLISNRNSSLQKGVYGRVSSVCDNKELFAPQALTSGIQSRYLISKGSRTMSDLTPSN